MKYTHIVLFSAFLFAISFDVAKAGGDVLQFRGVFGPQNYNIVNNIYYTSKIGLLTAWGDAGGISESDLRCLSSDFETADDTSGQLSINIYSAALDSFCVNSNRVTISSLVVLE